MIKFETPEAALDFIGKAIDLARAKSVGEFQLIGIGSFRLRPEASKPGQAERPLHGAELAMEAAREAALADETPEIVEQRLNDKWGVEDPQVTFKKGT